MNNFKRQYRNFMRPLLSRKDRPAGMARWEWYVGVWSGSVLEALAMSAKKRGDLHEFNHLLVAVVIGNSFHGDDRHVCVLPHDRIITLDEPLVFTLDSVSNYSKKAQSPAHS